MVKFIDRKQNGGSQELGEGKNGEYSVDTEFWYGEMKIHNFLQEGLRSPRQNSTSIPNFEETSLE